MSVGKMISVIIPVYNGERYIERCLNSLINQNYKNFEIIIIDDGSLDSTQEIINQAYSKDKRIKYFYQKNQGVSVARNKGIEVSKGKYITFLDVDDYFNNERFNIFADSNPEFDIIITGYKSIDEFGNLLNDFSFSESFILNENIIDYIINDSRVNGYCWNKYYSKEIIDNNKIKFSESLDFAEDLIFNLQYIKYTSSAKIYSESTYNYVKSDSSVTRSEDINSLQKKLTHLSAIEEALKFDMSQTSKNNLYKVYLLVGSGLYKRFVNNKALSNDEVNQLKIKIKTKYKDFKNENENNILEKKVYIKYFVNMNFPRISNAIKKIKF
ncbi:glycosyltransferase family 2 protein [Floricoccus penangensis]|uniref:glycosyltransferase family 2 protein n=1 Tax=Floricoccus penangensis TaxID=1859475 RepID=UPI00203AD40C|nr:glycosyltransferase family 2 protein [Floricoccus penangensis]URZ87627.1 glycosyltransferase family 2 protein [Floricoccus penangensis]